jgi:hypothetical protein
MTDSWTAGLRRTAVPWWTAEQLDCEEQLFHYVQLNCWVVRNSCSMVDSWTAGLWRTTVPWRTAGQLGCEEQLFYDGQLNSCIGKNSCFVMDFSEQLWRGEQLSLARSSCFRAVTRRQKAVLIEIGENLGRRRDVRMRKGPDCKWTMKNFHPS